MSLNTLNTLSKVPSNLWKIKQRVHYQDQIDNHISNDNGEFINIKVPKSASLAKLTIPTTIQTTDEEHQHHNYLTQSSSSPQNRTSQRTARSPCDHCGFHNIPIMTHLPISPLAKQQNHLELVDSSYSAHQALIPHETGMRRNDSSYTSIGVPSQELQISSRRPSLLLQDIIAMRRGSSKRDNGHAATRNPRSMGSLPETCDGSTVTINGHGGAGGGGGSCTGGGAKSFQAKQSKIKNRRVANDAISAALSATYCKLLVLLGVCLPITEVISNRIPTYVYQGFYVYLYVGSILFVSFLYIEAFRNRALFNVLKNYHEENNDVHVKQKAVPFGSFYLRVGAIAFAIGTMVYSGLEFGQFFELNGKPGCHNIFLAITPICRTILCIAQVQFIFLNTTFLDMAKHKVTSRFGLMHMVATNLCEWLYVLVEETKHEIFHIGHQSHAEHKTTGNWIALNATLRISERSADSVDHLVENIVPTTGTGTMARFSTVGHLTTSGGCTRTNIMGELVQEVSPFLFPCTIEYSLICAVMLYEMWKMVRSIPEIDKTRKHSIKPMHQKNVHHFSVDCSQSHKGLFFGILVIVMTIISMIMYFVLYTQPGYELIATQEVTLWETIVYFLCTVAVIAGTYLMRDLKYVKESPDDHHSMELDCMLLVVAQTGVYLYGMFSIMGSYFSRWDTVPDRVEGIIGEVFGLLETSLQTMFILHASHRRCKGSKQQRQKPGREIVTFLLVANIAIWFINTLIKGRAVFRATHLEFFGLWGWTIITHVSMPLSIFYRFHSTICLFEVWKISYKAKLH